MQLLIFITFIKKPQRTQKCDKIANEKNAVGQKVLLCLNELKYHSVTMSLSRITLIIKHNYNTLLIIIIQLFLWNILWLKKKVYNRI